MEYKGENSWNLSLSDSEVLTQCDQLLFAHLELLFVTQLPHRDRLYPQTASQILASLLSVVPVRYCHGNKADVFGGCLENEHRL